MVLRQAPEWHPRIDVMGEVIAELVWRHEETGDWIHAHTVRGDSTVTRCRKAAMLCDGAKPVDDSPQGEKRQDPQQRVDEWLASENRGRTEHAVYGEH